MGIKIGSGEIDDLALLNLLNEENLLRELRLRYRKGIIYVSIIVSSSLFFKHNLSFSLKTYIGDILLAINPFKQLNIYEKQVEKRDIFFAYIIFSFSNMISIEMFNIVINWHRISFG